MLLKVGGAMMLCAVALATVVAVVVNMSGPKVKLISPAASVEPLTDEEETGEKSSGFDPGQRLEIDEPKPSGRWGLREDPRGAVRGQEASGCRACGQATHWNRAPR